MAFFLFRQREFCYDSSGEKMYLLRNIKLPVDHSQEELTKTIEKKIGRSPVDYHIYKRSIDARKSLNYVYQIVIEGEVSPKFQKRLKKDLVPHEEESLSLSNRNQVRDAVVVGMGPAGLFAAYELARSGVKVTLLERGGDLDERREKVERFFDEAILDEECNIQFGEGGAGTFSDGKLTSRSKDKRQREVFRIFVEHGAPEEILYDHMPHIGTDLLQEVLLSMRKQILAWGGEIYFHTKMESLLLEGKKVLGVHTEKGDFFGEKIILALGNSARDSFTYLSTVIPMEAKPFAVGFRIEHLQQNISRAQYKEEWKKMPPANYHLTYQNKDKSWQVYTFCMCPGGYVIAASSEEKRLCVNGMSYHAREGVNANSAILATVDEQIYGKGVLAGMEFQRWIESRAYEMGGGQYRAPIQKVGDFCQRKVSKELGEVKPTYRPGVQFAPLHEIYPEEITKALTTAIQSMDAKLQGFASEDSLLTGVETRSSSPVRMVREHYLSVGFENLYPIGEGAGYAGGIVSSALDGIKCALEILEGEV